MKMDLSLRAQWWLIPIKGDLLVYLPRNRVAVVLGKYTDLPDRNGEGIYEVWTPDEEEKHWTLSLERNNWEIWRP